MQFRRPSFRLGWPGPVRAGADRRTAGPGGIRARDADARGPFLSTDASRTREREQHQRRQIVPRARREREAAREFTVVFYGLKDFCCKTAQFSERRRESVWVWSALKNTLRKVTKNCAKTLF